MPRQISKSNEQEISLLFQAAMVKLDQVEAQANTEKTEIVQDLAKALDGKIPTDTIAIEIIHQLHGKVSERLIHDCLEEKYKQKHRVENARKRKKRMQRDHEILAAPVLLNPSSTNQEENDVLIDTTGRAISEPQSPRSKADPLSGTTVDSDTEALVSSEERNSQADDIPKITDDDREKSAAGIYVKYDDLSNTELIQLIRHRDEQIFSLSETHTFDTNNIIDLEVALAKTTLKTAEQMPKTEIKDVVTDLEEFEADKVPYQALHEDKQLLQNAIWYIEGLQNRLKLHNIKLVIEKKEFPEQKPR